MAVLFVVSLVKLLAFADELEGVSAAAVAGKMKVKMTEIGQERARSWARAAAHPRVERVGCSKKRPESY